ncbi:MAG: 3'(2'),5'-bisphosphate nucleotidase CysQ [Deltaproteobacteria bacterium]|nr:3'(2'),5'-bisphosphate nucleotidase CysQ [Deltaproteobacteria bacterium]
MVLIDTQTNLDQELKVAKKLAIAAGEIILEHYSQKISVQFKDVSKSDPVTQADKDANQLIVNGLIAEFPHDAILAEESPQSDERYSRYRLWCVDPLDGTREFIERNGQFAVMIGLAIYGKATLGVVYHPTSATLYWGVKSQAFRQHKDEHPVALSSTKNTDLKQARIMVSRSHRSQSVSRVIKTLGITKIEPHGSVGLKVVRIAEGSADVYLSLSNKTQEWDACASEAIITAAGGCMTDALGKPLLYNKTVPNTPHGMLATNSLLHKRCVDAVIPLAQERNWYSE